MQEPPFLKGTKRLYRYRSKLFRILTFQLPDLGEPRGPVVYCQESPLLVLAYDGIYFKVSKARPCFHYGGAFRYVAAVGYRPPAVVGAAPLLVLAVLSPEMRVEVAAGTLCGPYMLVDGFCRWGGTALQFQPAADLLRTVVHAQHVADFLPGILAVLPVGMLYAQPFGGELLGLVRVVYGPRLVAPYFPAYGALAHFQRLRYVSVGPSGLQVRRYLVSL